MESHHLGGGRAEPVGTAFHRRLFHGRSLHQARCDRDRLGAVAGLAVVRDGLRDDGHLTHSRSRWIDAVEVEFESNDTVG